VPPLFTSTYITPNDWLTGALLNRLDTDDDADDDADHTMGPSGLGISPGSVREADWDDLTAVLTISEPSRR